MKTSEDSKEEEEEEEEEREEEEKEGAWLPSTKGRLMIPPLVQSYSCANWYHSLGYF